MKSRRTVWFLLGLLWAVVFIAAILADRATADWVRHAPLYHRTDWFVPLIKLPGNFLLALPIGVLLAIFHRRGWRAAFPLLIAGPLVGLGYLLLKWIVGRRRPVIVAAPFDFHPFAHGLGGLIHAESGLSFPSGHAAMAFATATCLSAALPRWAPVFFIVALAVGAERVLENAHYVSDVVAGATVGVLGGYLAVLIVRRWFTLDNGPRGFEPIVSSQPDETRSSV